MCKGSKMEKREKATKKMQQTKKKVNCIVKTCKQRKKNAKQVKQKNYDVQNKKRVSQTRTSKYESIRNFQVKEQSGAQVRLGPLYLCEDESFMQHKRCTTLP